MSELLQEKNDLPDRAIAQDAGKVTLLQELAEPVDFLSPDRSNRSTPPSNTDFDDQ